MPVTLPVAAPSRSFPSSSQPPCIPCALHCDVCSSAPPKTKDARGARCVKGAQRSNFSVKANGQTFDPKSSVCVLSSIDFACCILHLHAAPLGVKARIAAAARVAQLAWRRHDARARSDRVSVGRVSTCFQGRPTPHDADYNRARLALDAGLGVDFTCTGLALNMFYGTLCSH